ncbi:MAG: Lrp/AsnC family transcriptional regulator [Burkholderiaceae bacterium]|jgi:DNA-binding Lrp family transcriptional regulator|nr:Lrp/AsnC family transcriptional regulator [Burkholderiaceae bacterium]
MLPPSRPVFDPAVLYDRAMQHDFPLAERPYRLWAERLGCTEQALLEQLTSDLDAGRISRIGAVFAPGAIGASTLAALAADPARLDEVARQVSAHPAVSHNYAREGHAYNLWFVAGARDRQQLDAVLRDIAKTTGLTPLDLPMEREFHIDLGFALGPDAPAAPRPPRPAVERPKLDDADWWLIAALENGLALTPRPYDALARRAGIAPEVALARLGAWRQSGVIRRLGVVLQHRRLGYTRNLMCVWDWPDDAVDAFGARLAQLPCVNLCYRRARRGADWPYNLFVMLHPRNAQQAEQALQQLAQAGAAPHRVLPSQTCYKQRGMRYAAAEPAPASAEAQP